LRVRTAQGFHQYYSRALHVFAIQLSLFLRSDSRLKCDIYTGSQSVRSPLVRPLHPSLNALPRSCTLCRKTLRIKPATTQIMRIIPLKTPATPAYRTSSYACFRKEIQTKLNVRRRYANSTLYVVPLASRLNSPRTFFLAFFFSASRVRFPVRFRLTRDPVLWFLSQRPSRFAFSAAKATFTLCRRDHPDGPTATNLLLARRHQSWPWPNVCSPAHQTVAKTTVYGCRPYK
jgi:hypothetical protein